MPVKIVAAVIAVALFIAYLAPVVVRLNEVALWIVAVSGAGMMLLDLWESLKAKDD
jgi:hypothetical protein